MFTKKSKVLSLILVIAVLATAFISACGKSDDASSSVEETVESSEPAPTTTETTGLSFKPGTYTGEGDGFGGKFQVEVEVTETEIKGIKVLENHETEGIGTTALEIMPEDMIKFQSTGIDAVSGCTVSSGALRSAVNSALEQSGVDMDAVKKTPEKPAPSTEVKDITTDVLVIGGGGSGMTAAISATENGADVLLVEKMQFLGGAASISGGQVNAGGSNYQKEHGVTDDSAELVAQDLYKGGHDLNDKTLVKMYSENVGKTFDWLHDTVGVGFGEEPVAAAEHSVPRIFFGEGNAPGINASIKKHLESTGAEILMSTEVKELVVEDGTVVGATAVNKDGTTYNIKADTIVLCTGGYGYNKELLSEELQKVMYYGPVSSTGSGLIMAEELGAKTQMIEYGKVYPNGIEIAPGIGRSTISANTAVFTQTGTILVDKEGKRVVNERGLLSDIRSALFAQPDQTLYLVMDEDAFGLFRENLNEHKYANESEIERWLENNGESSPIFAHGETLEAAAEAAGINSETLKATVDNYTAMAEAGEDTEFGREVTATLAGDSKQYYIVEQKPRFATTLGGLVINENMQVVNMEDEVIPGLLAAGVVVGGLHGDDSMLSVCVSWAFTSGKLAGEKAAGAETTEKTQTVESSEAQLEEPAATETSDDTSKAA